MEHQEEQQQGKWTGKFTAKLTGPKADQIWPFFQDFCNFHRWHPTVDVCQCVEGEQGQPGCVRYCAGTLSSSDGGEKTISWVKEKLVAIDPIGRTLTYEIIDSNSGLGGYVATVAVLPEPNDGCTIEWSFEADPVEGWTREAFVSFIVESTFQKVVKRMEEDALGLGQKQSQ
ncbi:hypothetical protein MRB53_017744 [Persea americana]|uniref:Uncharacterized protein n=1 Tax=Persea americana TaxID=3435 RepID=A0ACC2M5Z3_PERAE|nr:hypothetical protein MRB53_017744 [Persea americana]